MGKQEEVKPAQTVEAAPENPLLKQILERMSALEAQVAEKDKTIQELQEEAKQPKTYTAGKQPIDEMIGHIPQRAPITTTSPNGTKRTDH